MPSSVAASIPPAGHRTPIFGSGFYTTTNRDQAENWANRKAAHTRDLPIVLQLTIDRDALARLRTLAFVLPTPDYWSLVERCRDESDTPYPIEEHYDVIYGPVAKLWFGPSAYTIIEGYDQTSFHGEAAKAFLNNRMVCKVEVAE
jgi:hypothetical protein